MLCQFIFKNFKSYRDETLFDMQAASIPEFEDGLLHSENDNKVFLPVSAIYGANASGKSGVLEALNCLATLVANPIMGVFNIKRSPFYMHTDTHPFAFDNTSKNTPTMFTLFYREKENEFRYSVSEFSGNIVAESLHKRVVGGSRTALLFERDEKGIKLGPSMKKKTINTNVNSQMPFLSFLAFSYDIPIIKLATRFFSGVFICSPDIAGIFTDQSDMHIKKKILTSMREIDIPVSDYQIEKIGKDEKSQYRITVIHNVDGIEYPLDILQESQGTQKLFALLGIVIAVLSLGHILVVDELDSSLHPKLMRYLIKLFKSKENNPNGAQLIFTTHDVAIMRNDVFRRDEIWFASKAEDGASEIYSLYDIRDTDGERVRATAPFYKQYSEGRYGAEPYLINVDDANRGE